MRIDLYLHDGNGDIGDDSSALERLSKQVAALTKGQKKIMADLGPIAAQVASISEVVPSAVALLNDLAQQLRDFADDPAEIQALADQLAANSDQLAAAVVANTPAG